ncbi:hypothetical protein [Micromonospora aurantiaca (nom. illeg.)]|uniref:hypothetical protein n=1 Tax=Micromonospora aurantiaca (nom. illeg.) TaxID=47850 RepID=UPI0033E367D6
MQHNVRSPQPPHHPHLHSADTDVVATLVASVTAEVSGVFDMMDWAEDEIAKATRRHPGQADAIFHAFSLIRPGHFGLAMPSEFVYRSHAAELLQRVAVVAGTTGATAAELCLVCAEASQLAPMHGAAAGLYFRLWRTAFPDHPHTAELADQQVHYEKLHGSRMDELEQVVRRKFTDPHRRLIDIECSGTHHGELVTCRFAAAPAEAARRPGRRSRRRTTTPSAAASPPESPDTVVPDAAA